MAEPLERAPADARAKADVVLVLITAFWGATFVVVKDALSLADPFSFLSLRFLVGALVATAFANRRMLHRPSVIAGLKLAGFLFLGYGLQTWGLNYTSPSRSAFITGLCVVLVPFVSFALFKRAPRAFSIIGVIFAAAGLYLLTLGAASSAETLLKTGLGDFLTLLCAIAYAVHITLLERYSREAHTTTLVATQLWVVSVLAGLLALVFPHKFDPKLPLVLAILLTGIFGSAVCIMLQTWAQARTTAVRAGLIYSLEPVFAAGASVALGREVLGAEEVVGGAMIIAGVLVAELGAPVTAWLRKRTA